MLKFFDYFRSSASYRVRIALNYKGLDYTRETVHLIRDGGQQFTTQYSALNPQSLVPTLVDGEHALTQSLAIIEYLEEKYPEPALLPRDAIDRARVRSIALSIACDIHPLNNLRVWKYLVEQAGFNEEKKMDWYFHWIHAGFTALEKRLASHPQTGKFCDGDSPTMADICLVPQIYNANRFNCPMDHYPTLVRINENCLKLPAFAKAHPNLQSDAE
jgi:maleylpyruvate isomerase